MGIAHIEPRIASLEGSYRQVSDRLNSIDHRLDGFEQRVDAGFDAMEQRFRIVDAAIATNQWRTTALMLTTWVTLLAAILLHR